MYSTKYSVYSPGPETENSSLLSCLRADREPDHTLEQSLLNVPLLQTEETETPEVMQVEDPQLILDDIPEPLDMPHFELQQLPAQTPDPPSTPERLGIKPTRPRSEGFRSRSERRRSTSPIPSPVRSPRLSLRDRHESEGRARGYRCRNNCNPDQTFSTMGNRNRHESFDCPLSQQVDIKSDNTLICVHYLIICLPGAFAIKS